MYPGFISVVFSIFLQFVVVIIVRCCRPIHHSDCVVNFVPLYEHVGITLLRNKDGWMDGWIGREWHENKRQWNGWSIRSLKFSFFRIFFIRLNTLMGLGVASEVDARRQLCQASIVPVLVVFGIRVHSAGSFLPRTQCKAVVSKVSAY